MKDEVRVSLVQFSSTVLDCPGNVKRMAEFVEREAAEHGAELVVFPELSTTGYIRSARDDAYAEHLYAASELVPGPTTEALGEAARRSGAHVVVGMSQRHPHIPEVLYNSAVLIDPSGDVTGVQHKVHPCRDEKEYYVPGDVISVFPTALGTLALNVCYDVRFPEMARVQTLAGAEIVVSLWASAVQPGKVPSDSIVSRCATRAMENAVFFLGCNRTGTDDEQRFYGRSAVAGPSGDVLARSDDDREDAVRAVLLGANLKAQRRYLTIFRDRRPELYGRVTEPLSRPEAR
ncbi:carbon-nitrogen hydrolase family protein [Amycolatopsis rubida]|uniref:Carbon-nitrogen hydrolase family protein n=1 Tax=Amycolatopsis rubida TaxID=112413 RepID=A0ABX0BSQ7_9PSEU|nr:MULTISPECIES: carbon-nitrogen hydrolase family protein [Amycolatopsis]MYW90870.1 carbon-nitrogen hydrolase family protein [Amycolatopsis rubida]NEC55855.1 carbon-nitrogen hydrolase family protein [Amycolatopsis rubida]OAP26064.1 (R)-stereoselective amidase [Amycolatopsis sp. M39]